MRHCWSLSRQIVPWLLGALVVGLFVEPAAARSHSPAAKAKRRVAVAAFSGPKSDEARNAVLAALKADDEYDVSDASDVAADADDKSCAKASRSLKVQALITGTVKKGSTLVLSVHNGKNGKLIQDVEIEGGSPAKLDKNIGESLTLSVADVIAQGKAPGRAQPDDDEDEPKSPAKKDDDEDEKPRAGDEKPAREARKRKKGPSAFDAALGVSGTRRTFDYKDTLDQLHPAGGFPVPLTYVMPLGPSIFADLRFYPLALGDSRSFADDIGLIAGGEFGIPLKVVLDQGGPTELTTNTHQFYAGLRDRVRTRRAEIGFSAAFGQHAYSLKGDIRPAPAFKSLTYTFVKAGIDVRLNFGDVFLGAHAGPRFVLNPGGIRDVFPHAKATALEAGLSGGYALSESLDLALGVDFLRYALNFNPIDQNTQEDGTPRVAGGAVDQYLTGWAAVQLHF